jgi:hypothetical protein
MLRTSLIVIFAILTLVSILVAAFTDLARMWMAVVWAALLLLSLLFERTRYKSELTAAPGPDWVATNELDVDARGTVRVWYHPRTGERAYVRESAT